MRKKVVAFLRGFGNLWLVCGLAIGAQFLSVRLLPDLAAKLLAGVLLLVLYAFCVRWVEGVAPADVRLRDLPGGLSAGVALGIALFGSLMAILWLARIYHPSGVSGWQVLPAALLSAVASAAFEEVVFRGFLFRLIAGLGGNWIALGVNSALFGLAHIGNPHATWASSAAIAIEAGILLGAAYAASGTLWLPIGIHAGWNFAEGPVFGMEVSGHAGRAGWIGGYLAGPEILTGGAFGPEASIFAMAVCLPLAAIYLRRMRRAASLQDAAMQPAPQNGD